MIKQLSIFLLCSGLTSHALAQSCHLANTGFRFPVYTNYRYGPNVDAAATANADVHTSIAIGRTAWDVTDAVGRIGTWTLSVSASDCPKLLPFQLGAFNFQTDPCSTNVYHGISPTGILAFVDWPIAGYPAGWTGTQSVSANLVYTFAVNGSPLPGQFDLRAVLAHEFGHVLGLHHTSGGVCSSSASHCSFSPNRDTMEGSIGDGPNDSCQVTVETATDKANIDSYY